MCEWRETGLNYRFRADQRAGVEPVFFQGVNDLGDGSSRANGGLWEGRTLQVH